MYSEFAGFFSKAAYEDQLKTSPGVGVKIFRKKPHRVKGGEEKFFVKQKKFSLKYTISIIFTTLQIPSQIYILGFYSDKNTKLHDIFAVKTMVETVMEALPLLIMYFFN